MRAHCEPEVRQRAVLQREQLLRDGRRFLRERELVSAGLGCVLGEEDGLGWSQGANVLPGAFVMRCIWGALMVWDSWMRRTIIDLMNKTAN